ncbi:tetratricopeptide repeat protein [Tenacibaculum sp.]|uniref:tetratricopeptide repeat protein n=1 Tax=Tenacibaculum sp. TaxID=1906242 RepID=UPI003D1443A5
MNAQDSIPPSVDINEKNNLEFQQHFFKALSDKAIFNYQKAIEHLEKCNQILPNNKAVLFELSKNYDKLGRNPEALNYIDLALNEEPDNLWMLEHKVATLRKLANFDDAIIAQQKIATTHPKKKQVLVFLHLQNNNIEGAKKVLAELKEAKLLNARLRKIEEKILQRDSITPKPKKIIVTTDTRLQFEKEKSFDNLKALLEKLANDNDPDLLKYSEEGLILFPAQPLVYLMNGKAHNNNKEFKKALESLQNGIDFVIDNNEIEAKFYLEISKAYQGLNDIKKSNSYKNKAVKILK